MSLDFNGVPGWRLWRMMIPVPGEWWNTDRRQLLDINKFAGCQAIYYYCPSLGALVILVSLDLSGAEYSTSGGDGALE